MSAANIAIFVGALASQGLGEQKVSPLAGLELDSRSVRLEARFDASHKVESGKGWIGSATATGKYNALRLGAAVVHRDGGVWQKDTLWIEPGFQVGPAELSYRQSVYGATEREQGVRLRLELGRWAQGEAQAIRHHQGDVGFTAALMFRVGGERGAGKVSK